MHDLLGNLTQSVRLPSGKDTFDREDECACDPSNVTETWFDQCVNDSECDDTEDDREPRGETRRDEFKQLLVTAPFTFLDCTMEYFSGIWRYRPISIIKW
ncbi:hypothetical protein [Halalkalicoccus ordinarius]|uniref:hypothetical protein n=1 Tax=Halalkalicoccus ordinarius TaxID=3116651 RepID=UPI00300F3C6F